jgi:2-(1,2-epoxy-1,2-dihydrophenyl)acetyl-CoA isomerase
MISNYLRKFGMTETLLFSKQDNTATITFNRPSEMNTFDARMGDELAKVLGEVANDDSVRAVLLNGSGHLFMAGGDIQFFYDHLDTMPEGVMEIIHALNFSIKQLMMMPKPVLASVHGSVAGVGVSLIMACDLVIAAENTKFTMAYSGLGISPDGGASYNLPRIVGAKKAMEWLLLSNVFDAHEAKLNGLINWVVPEDQLEDQTHRLMKRLANGPTKSYGHTKKLVNQSWDHDLDKQLECEGLAFEACTKSADFKSGVTHFLHKSKPVFLGE